MPPPKDPQKAKEWRKNLILAWRSPIRREMMSEFLKGRKFSKETREKISKFARNLLNLWRMDIFTINDDS